MRNRACMFILNFDSKDLLSLFIYLNVKVLLYQKIRSKTMKTEINRRLRIVLSVHTNMTICFEKLSVAKYTFYAVSLSWYLHLNVNLFFLRCILASTFLLGRSSMIGRRKKTKQTETLIGCLRGLPKRGFGQLSNHSVCPCA